MLPLCTLLPHPAEVLSPISRQMDGYEATRKVRNSSDISIDDSLRKVPVIAVTASAIKGDKEKCEAAGMDDYLINPVGMKELERVLVKWALRSQKVER